MSAVSQADLALVAGFNAGDERAAERLLARVKDVMWSACRLCAIDEAAARETFSVLLRDLLDGRLRRHLRAYDGRSGIERFVALLLREILEEQLRDLLRTDPDRGWAAFTHFFERDMRQIIFQKLPGPENEQLREDAYAEICLALIEDGYRRLQAYNASGSFGGLVRKEVGNACVDFIRHVKGRRREPVWGSELEATVYRLVQDDGIEPQLEVLLPLIEQRLPPPPPPADELVRAMRAVLQALERAPRRSTVDVELVGAELVSPDATPEEAFIESEEAQQRATLIGQVRAAARELPALEQVYLRVVFSSAVSLKASQIAEIMRLPVAEVYAMRPRVLKHLRARLKPELGGTQR